MGIWFSVVMFLVGFVLLIFGGDWFVDGATGIARRFRIPELLIGATVVSIGTTLPEVMVSAGAALKGSSAMAYGNAIGSIICNTALISALTIAIRPMPVARKSFIKPVIFFFTAAIFYAIMAYGSFGGVQGNFTRISGLILLAGFVAYMITLVMQARKDMKAGVKAEDEGKEEGKENSMLKNIVLLVVGAVAIAFGADLLVDHGTILATAIGVPASVIALTVVALGTSLPELITAITSLIKGHGSLSLGNIVGANLFNLVLVCGIAITLHPFSIPVEKTIAGMNASLLVDIPVMLFVMGIMTIPTLIREKLSRWQGIVLLATYAGYLVFQFAL